MRKHHLAFVDIETTGLNAQEHEILEIGCVLTDSELKILDEFEMKIKPEHMERADPVALKVNRYQAKDWQEALPLEEALKIFSKKVEGCIMVGQNVAFYSGFLEANLARFGLLNTMHYHKLDTISIAWAKLHQQPDIDHFSLREMCQYFGIENREPHQALSDARATFELYKKLMSL